MNKEIKSISAFSKVIIVLGILLIGYNLFIGATIQEIGIPGFTIKFWDKDNSNSSNRPPATDTRKYRMDNLDHRIIIVTHLQNNRYRIEEPSSPWPWEGEAKIDGGQLIGEANFRNSLASMKLEGVERGDKSIVIKYKYITDSNGSPSNRVDNHIWYPVN